MQRRAWWVAAGIAVIVIVAIGAVFFLRRDDGRPSAQGCHFVTPPSGAPVGDTAGVKVVEQGYTRIPPSTTTVSMGAVLQNTTAKVAYRTRVKFDVLNGAGTSVVWENHRNFMMQEVPIIPPGAKVAVGDALALTKSARSDRGAVARVSITAAVSQWLDAGDGSHGLGAVTTTVVPGKGQRDADGTGSVVFTADSPNCAVMASRGSSMIFRNASGTIVGGSLSTDLLPHACEPGVTGEDSAISTLRSIPESADLEKTEITAYCDFTRPPRSTELGAPIN